TPRHDPCRPPRTLSNHDQPTQRSLNMRTRRSLPILAPILGLLLLAPAASAQAGQPCPSTLNPPVLPFETCQTVGVGTIASGSRAASAGRGNRGPPPTNARFDVCDEGSYAQHAPRWYDQNGTLTRRHIYDHWTFGQWSNPLAGAAVPYTQTMIENDEYAIPGN